jgi:hypothetical protein
MVKGELQMAKNKYRVPKRIAGVKVPKTLRSTAKDMFANPIARDLLAAALVHAAATIVQNQSAKGSTTRQMFSDLGDAGMEAGKVGSMTIGQAVDSMLGYWNRTRSRGEPVARRQNKLKASKASKASTKAAAQQKAPKKNRKNGTEATAVH